MGLAGEALLVRETLEVPAVPDALGQQRANGHGVFRLLGVYCLHCPVEAAQKRSHRVMESFVLEPGDWLQKHRDDVVLWQRYAQYSEKIEKVHVPRIRAVVPIAVFLAMRPVGL